MNLLELQRRRRSNRPRLAPAEQQIVDAFRAGLSPDRIAEASRWTPMLVRKVLGEVGLLPPRRGRPYPYDAGAEVQIAASYEAGATMAELVARHGGSNRTISYVLEHRSIPARTKGRRPKAQVSGG